MTITLPADVREQAERQAKAAGFASVDEHVADLVREDGGEEIDWPPSPTAIRTAKELRAAIAAGEASPPIPSVGEFVAELRRITATAADQGNGS